MTKIFRSQEVKGLFPYFLLALAIIIAHRVVSEIDILASGLGRIWRILSPFFYGFLLAYIIDIPCGGIQKLLGKSNIKFFIKRKKGLSVILVFVIMLLVVYATLQLILPSIYRSLSFFIASFPEYQDSIFLFIDSVNNLDFLQALDISFSVDQMIEMFQDSMQDFSTHLSSSVDAIFSLSAAIFRGFLSIVASIYILLEKDKMKRFFVRMVRVFSPEEVASGIMKYASRMNYNCRQYLYTQTLAGGILAAMVSFHMYFIIRSPYVLPLAIMLGILNYIPYFGSIIGTSIAILVVALTQGPGTAVLAAVILLITQQIDANVIQPKLMSGSFSLSPLLVIISVTVGGAIAGVLGMIAAIPIVATLKDILESILAYYERNKAEKSYIT